MRKTTLALALVAAASTAPVLAQSVTDLVVMRRAIALPRPKPTPTPTPTPTFAPNTASCDAATPIYKQRASAVTIAQVTGVKTASDAISWCESQKVTKQYNTCYYDGIDVSNFSEWTGEPIYSTQKPAAVNGRHYTCIKR